MGVLDTFVYLFEADTDKLDKGLNDSGKKVDELNDKAEQAGKGMEQFGGKFLDMAKKAGALLGVGLSLGALAHGVQEAAAANFELEKLASRFRTTADAVDEFIDASGLLGISESTAKDGLKSLDSAIQDTAMGLGRAQKVFEDLGVTVKDASGKIKPTTAVMAELQSKFKDMDKGKQIRVMERLGLDPALLKLFNADMGDLRERMEQVDRMTGFSLENAVKKSGDFAKASKEMWLEIKTLKLYFDKLYEGMNVAAMPFFTRAMRIARDALHGVFELLAKHGHFAEGVVMAIGAAIAYFLVPSALSAAAAIWATIAPFVAIGAAVAAVAGLFAILYDDVMTFMEGGESMVGRLAAKWPIIGDIVKQIVASIKLLLDVAGSAFGFLVDLIDQPAKAFDNLGAAIGAAFDAFLEGSPLVIGVANSIGDAFEAMGAAVVGVWDAIIAAVRAAVEAIMGAISTVSGAFNSVKSFLGFGGGSDAVASGQQAIASASASPIAAQTSNSITNASKTASKTSNVTVQKVEVQTQATDAAGISAAIGNQLGTQLRQASANFDDGVMA